MEMVLMIVLVLYLGLIEMTLHVYDTGSLVYSETGQTIKGWMDKWFRELKMVITIKLIGTTFINIL
jgi:hypothetical protein